MRAPTTAVIALLVSLAGVAPAEQSTGLAKTKKTQPPDIFLITIDTLRADHVHCYGDKEIETPALDGLARDGVRFTEAFTPSPITNTSHASILTGLLPSSHGVTDFGVPLAAAHVTVAELLHRRGYHTAAFIGAVILDSKGLAPGFDRGFDFYDNFPANADPSSHWGRVERRGGEVVQHAEKWLSSHTVGPHFVWIHLYDPHDPYEPPPPFLEKYKDRLYDGEIAYADSALDGFVAYLKQQGWYTNALIVVVGDHGEGLGEHHENTHGIFLYDTTTHVPLIMKLPRGKSAGLVVDAQARTIDIQPTLLELSDTKIDNHFDGTSLRPFLFENETVNRVAIGETDYPLRFGWAPLRSVRAEGWKYIEAPRPELYNLGSDPGELLNLYEDRASKVKSLMDWLPPSTVTNTEASGTQAEFKDQPDPKDKIEQQNFLHTAFLAAEDKRLLDSRIALQQVLKLDPKSVPALKQLGQIEFETGNYDGAVKVLKTLRETRPDAESALLESQANQKLGNLTGAADALEASLKLNSTQPQARILLGKTYLELKNLPSAADQFEAAQLLDSNSVEAQLGLAEVRIAQGKFEDALPPLESLAKKYSSRADVFNLLAKAYAGLGEEREAKQAREKSAGLHEAK